MRSRSCISLIGIALIGGAGSVIVLHSWESSRDQLSLPINIPQRVERSVVRERASLAPSGSPLQPSSLPAVLPRPSRVFHDVPFVSQAPTGSWAQPYQDACEEAALVMAERWLTGKTVTPAEANLELLAMIKLETALFGDYRDTSAAQTVNLFRAFYKRDGRNSSLTGKW